MQVFFDFIESKFDDFRLNAQKIFGCRGILISIHPSMRSGKATHFSYSWPHQYWVACAAWVYNEFWNYYLMTNDEQFLKERVIPGLTEAALFFEDYLAERDEHGRLLFYPGMSPECTPKNDNQSSLTINTVMDIMACREILDNLLTAHEILGIKHEKTDLWKDILNSLPELILDEEGGLKEWASKETLEDYNHRCVSHHYDLWPGHAVTWEDTPELAAAIQISNRKRAQENDSAHGIMHRLFCAVRLKDRADTEHNLRQILEHGFITRSLMTNHYPYSVYFPDITGSFPAAVAEMAVYSNIGILEFLPAMPASLKKGSISGINCFNWTKVIHMQWDLNEGIIKAEICSLKTQRLELVYRKGISKIQVDNRKICVGAAKVTLELEKNRIVHIQVNI